MLKNISKKKVLFASALFITLVFLISTPSLQLASAQTSGPSSSPIPNSTNAASTFSIYASPSYLTASPGSTVTSTIRICSILQFQGTVDLSYTSSNGITCSLASASLSLKANGANTTTLSMAVPASLASNNYQVTVTGETSDGSSTHSATITLQVATPDFSIHANPASLSIITGTSEKVVVSLSSIGQFSGTVALTAAVPSGWQAPVFAQPQLALSSGKSASTTLTISMPSLYYTSSTDKYSVVVTGASGSLSHSVTLTVQMLNPDFIMGASPSTIYLTAGASGSSTLHVNSVGRFNGSVTLTASAPAGWTTPTLTSPQSISYDHTTATTHVSITVPSGALAGQYIITITGVSGALTHSATITVQVVQPDIALQSCPSLVQVAAGSSKSVTIGVVSIGRYNGTIALSVTPPSGWTTTFVKQSLEVKYNQSTNSTRMQITVPSSVTPGKYSVSVTGTSTPLGLTDTISITVIVKSP